MNEQPDARRTIEIPAAIKTCFRNDASFVDARLASGSATNAVRVSYLEPSETAPPDLSTEVLPLLALPRDMSVREDARDIHRVLVAVEGRDDEMAGALAAALDPERAMLALIHVTWVPGIAGSPIGESGLDDPHPSDLLAYRGAREALVDTRDELRRSGFSVSTHLRESKDPAVSIAGFIEERAVTLFTLGLGRHGAGIGRHVMERIRVPTLFVRAR